MADPVLNQHCLSRLSTILERATPESDLAVVSADVAELDAEFGRDEVRRCLVAKLAAAEFKLRGGAS